MAEHANVELVRRGYEAFSSGDGEALRELLAEDAVWRLGGRNLFSNDYRGHDSILGLFKQLADFTNGTLKVELHDVLANEEHAIALARYTASRARRSLEMNACDTFHIRDGRVIEFWSFPEDRYTADEFFSYRKHSLDKMP